MSCKIKEKKRRKRRLAVREHQVRMMEGRPVVVDLLLSSDDRVTVDLLHEQVQVTSGGHLTSKQRDWLLQIGAYLARMALAETEEKAREQRLEGGGTLAFDVRPDPGVTWWG